MRPHLKLSLTTADQLTALPQLLCTQPLQVSRYCACSARYANSRMFELLPERRLALSAEKADLSLFSPVFEWSFTQWVSEVGLWSAMKCV